MESTPNRHFRAWRLIPEQADYDPFSGKGAEKTGGRWNDKGISLVYTSSSISLAILETLANLRGIRINLRYLAYWVDIPEESCNALNHSFLENEFNHSQNALTRSIGNAWIKSYASVVLKVPSVVNKYESNFLLNPLHADFKTKLKFSSKKEAKIIELDPRLISHLTDC